MSDATLLSDLCGICNTTKSKYRCPGCAARTCSLPCYKRHQQWAQCSGQRDPTKFVKKSQLVTPAGIDHDFNFLTSIERDIEKAEKGLEASATTRLSWSQKGETNYQHLEAAGVKVIRAPKGLSRQKENKSHRTRTKKADGSHNIAWTVEWLDNQGNRQLTQTSSKAQLDAAQPFTQLEKHKIKKRKRDVEPSLTSDFSIVEHDTTTSENQNKFFQHKVNEVIKQSREHSPSGRQSSDRDEPNTADVKVKLAQMNAPDHRHDGSSTKSMGDGECRFYLVKPRTSSSKHVLIPLTATAMLGDCLKSRTVLEFPTIFVFPHSSHQLPDGFMLEEDYLKQIGEDQKEFDELIRELDPEILKRLKDGEQQAGDNAKEGAVDSRAILDVLKKDFGTMLD